MCDAFAKENSVNLFVPSSSSSINRLKKDYNLKNKFKLIEIFQKNTKLNFFKRLLYSFKIINHKKKEFNKKNLIISRSVIFAILCNFYSNNIILELHHKLSGLTKFFYFVINSLGLLKNLKYIFIHKNLIDYFNVKKENYICLDDAVDIKDFKIKKKSKKLKNTCVYVGSFHPGKGLELILDLAKKLNNIDFHLYGDKTFINNISKTKNVKIFGFSKYCNVPKILSKYEIALMPYGNFISGRLSNINLADSISPLKMFDYLASGIIILASDLKVYKHILKHKKNSILIKNTKLENWQNWINEIFKHKNKYNYVKKNGLITANKYTWYKRANQIINFT